MFYFLPMQIAFKERKRNKASVVSTHTYTYSQDIHNYSKCRRVIIVGALLSNVGFRKSKHKITLT